jgi:hypothetical protein
MVRGIKSSTVRPGSEQHGRVVQSPICQTEISEGSYIIKSIRKALAYPFSRPVQRFQDHNRRILYAFP